MIWNCRNTFWYGFKKVEAISSNGMLERCDVFGVGIRQVTVTASEETSEKPSSKKKKKKKKKEIDKYYSKKSKSARDSVLIEEYFHPFAFREIDQVMAIFDATTDEQPMFCLPMQEGDPGFGNDETDVFARWRRQFDSLHFYAFTKEHKGRPS